MTNRPTPNPQETPMCPKINKYYEIMIYGRKLSFYERKDWEDYLKHHRATCPVCRARIQAESDKEVKDEKL
jgi:hypothetical protein